MATDIKTHIANFKKWLGTDQEDAATWQNERKVRLAWYRSHLTQGSIAKLTREDFATLVKSLWAVNIWHNKDYKVGKLIEDNSLEKLRDSLGEVFYGTASIEQRWDAFRATIKGFGPSSLVSFLRFTTHKGTHS